jgi:hypothetical protein
MSGHKLLSESEISDILKAVKPLVVESNKTINSLLTIKKWGFHALNDAVSKTTLTDEVLAREVVKLAICLSEFDFHLIERAVSTAGVPTCAEVLEEVTRLVERAEKSIEFLADNRDALFTIDGLRRTPGGIFWRFLKARVSKEDAKYIFKDNTKRQQGLRRQIVREKWTENHLTILSTRKKQRVSATDEKLQTVKDIASELSMSEVSIIERLVVRKGVEYARIILKEVNEVLGKGVDDPFIKSLVQVSQSEDGPARRRTPGGVFAQLIKNKADLSEHDRKFIFARASGGRAPSMSDLMSMSLALQDRAVTVPRKVQKPETERKEAKPQAKDEWEFQRKVGNTWEPGFIGQENYGEPPSELSTSENDPVESIFANIARGLKLYSVDFIERVNQVVDLPAVVAAYKETVEIEKAGGLAISDSNPRKRTPKGVFIAVLRKQLGDAAVDEILGLVDSGAAAPQVIFDSDAGASAKPLADRIIVELERLRIPESDFDIVRTLVALKGEPFVRGLFEKVRKRFNKGKWLDTPGQLFGKMLKVGLTNDEINQAFEASRAKQLARNNKRALTRRPTVLLSPNEERCANEITLGIALIGVTASEVSMVERIVERLGEEVALTLLKRTKEIEREGGQKTRDQLRRKTPSGVFLSLLSTEMKGISKEDLKYVFDKPAGSSSSEDRKKEDSHFAPSLFTPINPLRVIDQSGKDQEFVERVKKQIRPTLAKLEYVSVLDPRLETVIRGVVLLGPSAIHLIDQCVYVFGEKRTEGWLEISHAQVADSKVSIEQLSSIYEDLVKAAGGIPSLETSAGVRC